MDPSAAQRGRQQVSLLGYAVTYAALLLLASVSLVLSRFHLSGGMVVALLIALAKACAVLWFFMHLVEEHASSRFAVLVALSLMVLLITLTTVDVATRHTFPPQAEVPPASSFYVR
jgi:caa(3)-type oxidase subunit IV